MRTQKKTIMGLIRSWDTVENPFNSTDEILVWIKKRNKEILVNIKHIRLSESKFWFLDMKDFRIRNRNGSFFEISGIRIEEDNAIICEQPIILQNEIGYNGILCKEIDGVIYLLMQAKIEPGNVNRIQISPTIQATKSNFTQKHGGALPPYLDYFINASRYEIIVDQLQSEQSSRFYIKRNRNIMLKVDEELAVLPNHTWMTLGQIKQLLSYDNIVNMDTRTVISCIPYSMFTYTSEELNHIRGLFKDEYLYQSIFVGGIDGELPEVYRYLNDYKMFSEKKIRLIPLNKLTEWDIEDDSIVCRYKSNFKVIFCDITIEGREVKQWTQPLFEATGMAVFGLFTCIRDGVRYFLVKAAQEIGCIDKIELGPSIQLESIDVEQEHKDPVVQYFFECLAKKHVSEKMKDVILSEEGGRFYHEQNRNVILDVPEKELPNLPEGYFLLDFQTLNILVQVNNCLNIQLRNLLSLLEM